MAKTVGIGNMEYDEWYARLLQELKNAGYGDLPVDHATCRGDYDLQMSPETSAELFITQFKIDD